MPESAVVPVLEYDDVRAAVDWLRDAFGFEERLRIGAHRAQLTFAGGALVIAAGREHQPVAAAASSVMVRVQNVDSHHERATKAGARIGNAPTTQPYGERQYDAVDPWGHRWTFSQTVRDVDPAEWGGTLLR